MGIDDDEVSSRENIAQARRPKGSSSTQAFQPPSGEDEIRGQQLFTLAVVAIVALRIDVKRSKGGAILKATRGLAALSN
jgi:hypothetical protein